MEIKIFKIKKSFRKGGLHTNPDVFWDIIQSMALLVVIGLLVFDFFLFNKINKEFTPPSNSANSQAETISKERIDKVLKYFSDRKNKSDDILNSPSPVIDPSL